MENARQFGILYDMNASATALMVLAAFLTLTGVGLLLGRRRLRLGAAMSLAGLVVVAVSGALAAWLQPDVTVSWIVTGLALGVGASGLVWLVRAVVGDRAGGRRRCPKCWYSMDGVPGLRCPECGRVAQDERHLCRARRSKWAIAMAFVMMLAAPGGLFARAWLATHPLRDAIPTWALVEALRLPEGSWRRDAFTITRDRIYEQLTLAEVGLVEDRLVGRMISSERARWDDPHWQLLATCRQRIEEPMSIVDLEALMTAVIDDAWERMSVESIKERRKGAQIMRVSDAVMMMLARGRREVPDWIVQRDALRLRLQALLVERAPNVRVPEIAENLASGEELLQRATLKLFVGGTAHPYSDELFALFDDLSERRPVGIGMSSAKAMRVPMTEDSSLFERFEPLLESSDPVDVRFVTQLLGSPLSFGAQSKTWSFANWQEWLLTQLESGPAESVHAVQYALFRLDKMVDRVLSLSADRIRSEPQNTKILLPGIETLDDNGQLAFLDTFEWLADSRDPEARFAFGWRLAMLRREGPDARRRAEELLTRMGIAFPPGDPAQSNFDYLYNDPLVRKDDDP